jgi:protocatechuate 3,4-dioxygenase alpha subunit
MSLERTSSQTVGPYFKIGLDWPDGAYVVPDGTPGAIWIRGRVLDGAGEPVPDAMIETWQADPEGRFEAPDGTTGVAFRGLGRCGTDDDGRFAILTVPPGAVPAPDGGRQAPHLDVSVFSRGLLKRLVTRLYFADQAAANATDPVLASVADPARRATLVAERTSDGYWFEVRLQGERETVFFDI